MTISLCVLCDDELLRRDLWSTFTFRRGFLFRDTRHLRD